MKKAITRIAILLTILNLDNVSAQTCPTLSLVTHPGGTTFCQGTQFVVKVIQQNGNNSFGYIWWKNGTPMNQQWAQPDSIIITESAVYSVSFFYPTPGCGGTFSPSVNITMISMPSPVVSAAGATYICSPDSSKLNVTSSGGTLQWKLNGTNINGATTSTYYAKLPGAYTCTETNSCTTIVSNAVSVYVNQTAPANIRSYVYGSTTFCLGTTVSTGLYLDSVAGSTYQWRLNGNDISGATGKSYTALQVGDYTCRFTNCAGNSISNTIKVSIDTNCTSSLYFDGNDFITIPANAAYSGFNNWTVEILFRDDQDPLDSTTYEPLFSNGSTFHLGISNGAFINGYGVSSGPDVRDGQCHIARITADAATSNWYTYIDNIYMYRTPASGTITTPGTMLIGAGEKSPGVLGYFKGTIKEVRLWNAANVSSDFTKVLDGNNNPSLIGCWRINNSAGQTIIDRSQYANHAVRGSSNAVETSDGSTATSCPSCVLPNVSISASGPVNFCYGNNVTLNASPTGAGYIYQWRWNDKIIEGAVSSSYTATQSGNYDVLVTNFCSAYSNKITVTVSGTLKTLILQPDAASGYDASIYADSVQKNGGNSPDFKISGWVQYSHLCERGLLKFDLSQLPVTTKIVSAELYLYNSPTAPLPGPGTTGQHFNLNGSNASLIQRVISPWIENTVNYANQPKISRTNEVMLPQNTTPHQDYVADVTSFARSMIESPATNYGMRLRLHNESYWRALLFATSDYPDATKRPKLKVTYYTTDAPVINAAALTASCGDSILLSVAATGVTYQWVLNGNIINGATGSSYYAKQSGVYTCSLTSPCSTVQTAGINITMGTPVAINGVTGFCRSSTGNIYTASSINGAVYNWTVPSGATITSGQGTNSIAVSFASNAAAGNISVAVTSNCGTANTSKAIVLRSAVPSTPGTITGSNNGCSGESKIYTIRKLNNADSYLWTPPIGATINGSSAAFATTDTFATVTFNASFTGDSLRVRGVNCRGNSAERKLRINHNSPGTPGAISGLNIGLCNQSNVAYSINAVTNATNYTWRSTIAGVTFNGNASPYTTTSPSVNITYTTFTTGQIYVKANNGCGSGAERSLTVNAKPAVPTIINGPTSVCDGQQGVAYSTSAVTNATAYNWTVPPGATVASGQTTTNITVNFGANPATGNVRVRSQNACASSAYLTKSITINNCPRIGNDEISAIRIQPNPFNESTLIYLPEELELSKCKVVIYDISGKEIVNIISPGDYRIQLTDKILSKGIYQIVLIYNNSISGTARIISQ